MDVCFIIGNNFDLTKYDFTNKIVVGIDRGAYLAFQNNIKLDYAVGDFDSISAQELEELYTYTNVVKLNPIKDDTDTLHALNMFKECDNLIILGGITGKRIDHFVANLKLFYREGGNIRAADGQAGCDLGRLGLGLGDLLGGDVHHGIRGSLGIGGGGRRGRLRGMEGIVLRGRAGHQLGEQHGYA